MAHDYNNSQLQIPEYYGEKHIIDLSIKMTPRSFGKKYKFLIIIELINICILIIENEEQVKNFFLPTQKKVCQHYALEAYYAYIEYILKKMVKRSLWSMLLPETSSESFLV